MIVLFVMEKKMSRTIRYSESTGQVHQTIQEVIIYLYQQSSRYESR